MSTVGIEAIVLGIPVLTVALDGERRFQEPYREVPKHFDDVEGLLAFLDVLAADRNNLFNLQVHQGTRRQRYFDEVSQNSDKSSAAAIVDILEERLDCI